jgi:hypothetical protein
MLAYFPASWHLQMRGYMCAIFPVALQEGMHHLVSLPSQLPDDKSLTQCRSPSALSKLP